MTSLPEENTREERSLFFGGGSVGCETADYLAPLIDDMFPANRDITVIEMTPSLMPGEGGAAKSQLTMRLKRKGVKIELNSQVTKVDETTIIMRKTDRSIISQMRIH